MMTGWDTVEKPKPDGAPVVLPTVFPVPVLKLEVLDTIEPDPTADHAAFPMVAPVIFTELAASASAQVPPEAEEPSGT